MTRWDRQGLHQERLIEACCRGQLDFHHLTLMRKEADGLDEIHSNGRYLRFG